MLGTLEPGVEAGCVILRADDGAQYLLVGPTKYPPAGTRVTVTGYFENNVASYCMQGNMTIHVVSISPLEIATSMFISYGTATASPATLITNSNLQSTTITGVSITTSGYIYTVVETPKCYPQCLAPSFIITYLYVPPGTNCSGLSACYQPPQFFRLLNKDSSTFSMTARNGTYAINVAGILVRPSTWNCSSFYIPNICMSGDIYVQNVTYS
jgi:hypothetical protein